MFENLITRRHDRARLEASPLRRQLEIFATVLEEQGYARRTIRRYLFAGDRFGQWLAAGRIELADVDDPTVERYVESLGRIRCAERPGGRCPDAASAARKLVGFLRVEEQIPWSPPHRFDDATLNAFHHYLEHEAGLSAGTRRIYGRYARRLLETRYMQAPADWAALTADDVTDFVRGQAARLKPTSCRPPVTATRAFLRFLISRGEVDAGLLGAAPTIRQWKHAALPKYLPTEDVARMLAACERSRPCGLRDFAIVTMLVRLGLRASEIANLQLDDLAWREGRVHVRAGKSGRARTLPLPEDAGQALAAYVQHGRPDASDRAVFLRARPPHGPLSSSAVSALVARTQRRGGVASARLGAHTLRHTAATHMVRRGATFKEVADVLGHARLETTRIYAKLDVETLAHVAVPWPGGEP